MNKNFTLCLSILLTIFTVTSIGYAADAPKPRKTVVLQHAMIPNSDHWLGMGIANFPPFAVKRRHKARGPEIVYVLSGEITLQIAGESKHTFRPGECFKIPAGAVHITTAGPQGARVLAAWVSTPGKVFNIPVPHAHK